MPTWIVSKAANCLVWLCRLILRLLSRCFSSDPNCEKASLEDIKQGLSNEDKHVLCVYGTLTSWKWVENGAKLSGGKCLTRAEVGKLCSQLRSDQVWLLYNGAKISIKVGCSDVGGPNKFSLWNLRCKLEGDPSLWDEGSLVARYLFPSTKQSEEVPGAPVIIKEVARRIEQERSDRVYELWRCVLPCFGMQIDLNVRQVVRGPNFLLAEGNRRTRGALISRVLDSAQCFDGLFGPGGEYRWMLDSFWELLLTQTIEYGAQLTEDQPGGYWSRRKQNYLRYWNQTAEDLGLEPVTQFEENSCPKARVRKSR